MAVPWLVSTDHAKQELLFHNFFERSSNKTQKGNIPEMNPAWFRYFQAPSHQGWLIVYCHRNKKYPKRSRLKYGDCFLWNPVSLEKIWLPSLCSWITDPKRNVRGAVLSSPPTINPTCDNDSVVFFLLVMIIDRDEYPLEHTILFCRPREKQWRSQTLPRIIYVLSLTCFKEKLHVLCNHYPNMHLVMEKQLGSDDEMSLSITTYTDPVAQDALTFSVNREISLLESRDELFVVVVNYHLRNEYCYENITSFQVFKMNFPLMVWEKVESLGDHVLFLGGRTMASCSAADLRLTEGHVYFTMPENKTVYVFDLKDGTISIHRAFPNSTKPCFQAEWLAMPLRYIKGNCRVNLEEESNMKTIVEGNKMEYCTTKKNEGITKLVKSRTSWGSLDMDILELIASYLHRVDYLHFREVCKTHRSVASILRKRTIQDISHTTSLSPWLIFHQNTKDCVYRFINPMHNNETYFINLSEFLLDATTHCSKGGWLLMSQSCKRNLLFFFNPFTKDVIRLPELPEHDCEFEGISFSSIPTSSDCIVFAINGNCSELVDTYSISRGDDSWCLNHHQDTNASTGEYLRFSLCRTTPVFFAGRFFCLGTCGTLAAFNLRRSEHSRRHDWEVFDDLVPACSCYHQSFLVEFEGQILLSVFVTPLNKMRPVQIFQLRSSKKSDRMEWVEVRDLGKYMLFVSHTSCVAAVAPVSRMRNKIYFPRLHNNRIVFFSLDTCRYRTIFLTVSSDQCDSSSSFDSTKKQLYCTWIEPNWLGTTTATDLVW